MVVSKSNRIVSNNTLPCGICNDQLFKYICPRCNLRYCSLTCYKDKSHVQCTESFYKDSVMNEIQSNPTRIPQDRKNMLQILDRFEKQAIDQENMLDKSEDEILDQVYHQQSRELNPAPRGSKRNQTSETDLKKPVDSHRKLTRSERNELIRKTIEQERDEMQNGKHDQQPTDLNMDSNHHEELELALEQEHQDLINRFQGVNLDEESFESIWERLTPEERREFQERFMLTNIAGEEENINEGDNVYVAEEEIISDNTANPTNADEDEEDELEARKLLQEMDETLRHGSEKYGKPDNNSSKLVDLDTEDLRAIRDAEISELIQIWQPWWEIEAEQAGQLKKIVTSTNEKTDSIKVGNLDNSTPTTNDTTRSTATEKYVLDEEAMMRPHQSLIQDLDEIAREEKERKLMTNGVPPLTRAPHPSLIYHICGLLFAYVATSRTLNGDLKESPEHTLAYIFDLCPFFSPPPPPPTKGRSISKAVSEQQSKEMQQALEVEDFETTLAILQASSLNSKLYKGDTLRLELLSILLCDLTLLLAHPSRALRSVQQLKEIFSSCIIPPPATSTSAPAAGTSTRGLPGNIAMMGQQKKQGQKLFSKSTLHRLLKKLEFYESYLASEEYFLKTNRLDLVRAEVVLTGMRIRQEKDGWTRELEDAIKAKNELVNNSSTASSDTGDNTTVQKPLIEEIS